MNNKTLKIIKICSTLVLSLLFIITAFYAYKDSIEHFYYMTFLGNFLTGVFLLIAGIFYICNKLVSQYLVLSFTILMLLILGIIFATQDFNISDGFLFLHFINPSMMLVYFLFISNQSKVRWQFMFTTLAMPFAYMIFAFIFGACTGDYIYYYLDYNEFGIGNTALFIFGIAVGLIAVSAGLYYLNRLIHKHILKDI